MKDILEGKVFGLTQVNIEVVDKFYDKISEMVRLFVIQEIPDCNIHEEMKMY